MGTGVFSLICPACGHRVQLRDAESASCSSCQQRYLYRVGHLLAMPGQGAAEIDLRTTPIEAPSTFDLRTSVDSLGDRG